MLIPFLPSLHEPAFSDLTLPSYRVVFTALPSVKKQLVNKAPLIDESESYLAADEAQTPVRQVENTAQLYPESALSSNVLPMWAQHLTFLAFLQQMWLLSCVKCRG